MLRSSFIFFLMFCLILFFLSACSPRKQKEARAPSSPSLNAVEIQPIDATRDTTFYISTRGIDYSKAKVKWLVNGVTVKNASSSQFRSSEIRKGDTVQAKVTIGNSETVSNQITIKNIPPAIEKAKILPAVSKVNDTLRIDVKGNDRDGDEVTLSFEWSKNGEHAGSGEFLEGPFKRGDKISVKITPFDGQDYGHPITLTTEIYNSPPRVSKDGAEKFENNIYSYQIKATDPDGDALTYNLKQAPQGMVIDKAGLITWKVGEKDAGRHPVTVQITDGRGGEALYNFYVTIGLK
jgi:hypothetical protein